MIPIRNLYLATSFGLALMAGAGDIALRHLGTELNNPKYAQAAALTRAQRMVEEPMQNHCWHAENIYSRGISRNPLERELERVHLKQCNRLMRINTNLAYKQQSTPHIAAYQRLETADWLARFATIYGFVIPLVLIPMSLGMNSQFRKLEDVNSLRSGGKE